MHSRAGEGANPTGELRIGHRNQAASAAQESGSTFQGKAQWLARSRGRWSDLPVRLGVHHSVKRRDCRWLKMVVLDDMLETLAREANLE